MTTSIPFVAVAPPRAERDDAHALLREWQAHDEAAWASSPASYIRTAEALRRVGEPLVAYDVIAEGLRHFSTNLRLRQLQGFTLAQSGDEERAIAAMTALAAEGGQSPDELEETLAVLARVWKERALRRSADADRAAVRARDAYLRAHEVSGGYYSGVNAAALSLRLGDAASARALAQSVGARAETMFDDGPAEQRYWAAATVAESALIRGDDERATQWYRRALECNDEPGLVASTRRNARLIADALGVDRKRVDDLLRVASVACVVASPSMSVESLFSADLENAVNALLDQTLAGRDAQFGYSSGAAGTDILLLESVMRRGGRTRIVLPYEAAEFIPDRVSRGGDGPWRERFDRAVASADEVVVATDRRFTAGTALQDYAERLLFGLARVHATALDTELTPFVVIDDGADQGEVDRSLASLRSHGLDPVVVDVASLRSVRVSLPRQSGANRPVDWAADTRILGILFADVLHSSSLTDDQQPLLVAHFLGRIGRLSRESANRPIWKNTWGDGLYMVFDDIGRAGRFALELRDVITDTPWQDVGLPKGLTMRIGLHAGPIFSYEDPITGYQNFTGRHTIRGARIEPVTLPGQVYASREFTALAADAFADDFVCTPVGRVTLAKNAATTSLFVLEWARGPESTEGAATR